MKSGIAFDMNSDAMDDAGHRLSVRKLFLRDSLIFLVLLLTTVVLYGVTSLLFRSFATRRDSLARQFAASGRQALQQKQPGKAVEALRTALEYAPDDRSVHLLLAEALAEAQHTEEAMNYFVSLRDSEPADGFINLELARLYRQKNDSAHAIESYRAAALGNWDQNGIAERLQAQLELSEYLIELGKLGPARAELLMAAGNAPESTDINIRLGDELQAANDPTEALAFYQKALKLDRHSFNALSKAGRAAYEIGDYGGARRLLQLALREQPDSLQAAELSMLLSNATRLLQLSMGRSLSAQERAEHIRTSTAIAKQRLDQCSAAFSAGALPPTLQTLKIRWQQAAPVAAHLAAQDMGVQDNIVQLIFDTEMQTSQSCGAPSGDDALLLHLAKTTPGTSQEKP